MNIRTEREKSDINYQLSKARPLLEILIEIYSPHYQAILGKLKSESQDKSEIVEMIASLYPWEIDYAARLADALCHRASELNLQLSTDEALAVLKRAYYAIYPFIIQFSETNLLDGFLCGFEIANHIQKGIAEEKYRLHKIYTPEGIIEIDGWIYGIENDCGLLRSLSCLREPGVDSTLYIFDGFNESFEFYNFLSDEQREKFQGVIEGDYEQN